MLSDMVASRQAGNAKSPLRAGLVTRYVEDVAISRDPSEIANDNEQVGISGASLGLVPEVAQVAGGAFTSFSSA
jgi:hypothetical protein